MAVTSSVLTASVTTSALTAAASTAALTALAATSALTAVTAAAARSDAEYQAVYAATYGAPVSGVLTASDARSGGPA